MCVLVPDVNAPGGTQGESSTASADVEEPSAPGEDSPKIADVEVEEPSTPRDDSPIPTGPRVDMDEPSVAGANSRAARQAMQDKEESAKPSGKPDASNADGRVNTPLGGGSSNQALGHNASSALTRELTSKKPAPSTAPLPAVSESTPQEFIGTVVDTAEGLAVQVGWEIIPVEDSVASILTPGQSEGGQKPDTETPVQREKEHDAEFRRRLTAPDGNPDGLSPAQRAEQTGQPVDGEYKGGWKLTSVSDGDLNNALGTFSVAFNTTYTVYPPDQYGNQKVEWERTTYVYDWYNFDPNHQGESETDYKIRNAAAAERAGIAQPFRTMGSSTEKGKPFYV